MPVIKLDSPTLDDVVFPPMPEGDDFLKDDFSILLVGVKPYSVDLVADRLAGGNIPPSYANFSIYPLSNPLQSRK